MSSDIEPKTSKARRVPMSEEGYEVINDVIIEIFCPKNPAEAPETRENRKNG